MGKVFVCAFAGALTFAFLNSYLGVVLLPSVTDSFVLNLTPFQSGGGYGPNGQPLP